MGINVSTTNGFANNDFLKKHATEILQKKGAEEQKAEEIIEKIIFGTNENTLYNEYSVLNVSTQIAVNNTLKETLRYLRAHANQNKHKKYILGELWDNFSENNESFNCELYNFEIDTNVRNIFAA